MGSKYTRVIGGKFFYILEAGLVMACPNYATIVD